MVAAEGCDTRALVLFEALQTRHVLRKARHYHGISQREEQVLDFLLERCTIKHVIAKTGANNRVQMEARILGWTSHATPADTLKH